MLMDVSLYEPFYPLIDRHSHEKDKIYGELISTKKKLEIAISDIARMELTYSRLGSEKEKLQLTTAEMQDQATKFREQVDEQFQIVLFY